MQRILQAEKLTHSTTQPKKQKCSIPVGRYQVQTKQETEVFDKPAAIVPVPSFAGELTLTIEDLFAWLLE